MKRILFVIIAMLMLASVGYCQEVKLPLQLTITSDRETYDAGEEIIVEYRIKNVSKEKLTVYDPKLLFCSGEFKIISPLLKELKYRGGCKDMNIVKDFFLPLLPNESVFVARNISSEYDLNIQGKYQITAFFSNGFTSYWSQDGKTEFPIDAWTGHIGSNTITIEVVEKNGAADYPASGLASKAKAIAEVYLSQQSYKNEYEEKAFNVEETDSYVNVEFRKKTGKTAHWSGQG